ncbi:MAG: ATP-grasp domain-containing protein [Deltaproteobacteria bacterium]|nr:ATP-grasp domain-containing protein [Deltaproteobacteria bacterium]
MPRVVFVAPYFMDATLRFVDAVASLPEVELGLVSADPADKLPPRLRSRLAGHYRIGKPLDPGALLHGAKMLGHHLGGVDRIIGSLEQLQVPLGWVRDRLGVAGMGEAASRRFRDKALMKDALRQAGLPCARHRRTNSAADVWAFVEEVGLPVIVKPRDGAAAAGTHRITSVDALKRALSSFVPEMVEEFVVGHERSFETASIEGHPQWDSHTRYDPSPLTVLENPWIQWTVVLPHETRTSDSEAIGPVAHAALRALGMHTGLSHMEWFRRADGSVAVSEVGARPPGAQIVSLNGWAHDTDMYRRWAELVTLDRWNVPPRQYAVAAAYFRGQGEGQRVVALHGIEQAQAELGHLVVEAKLPEPGQPKARSYEGEGYAIVRHPETLVVERAIQRLVSLVRVETG